MTIRPPFAALVMAVASASPLLADEPTPTPTNVAIDRAALPVRVEGIEGVQGGVFRDGRVLIGGQPSEAALKAIRDLGVTAVVNLRTPAEMNDRERVPFDEAAAVADLGMDYVHIPLGGDDHPYTSQAVEQFAAVLEDHPGPVLLHCTVAWRASYMWAAYLILYQDLPLASALDRGEAIAIDPPPLEGLLGRPLTLVYEE
jgi:uncharacterized protein (TIGR01244 family)